MGLFERWTADDSTKIPVHGFGAALSELARGAITRQNVIDEFELTGDDLTDLDAIIATHQALGSDDAKLAFRTTLEDVMILCEEGRYTKTVAKTRLGF